jgi:hypothetical protein
MKKSTLFQISALTMAVGMAVSGSAVALGNDSQDVTYEVNARFDEDYPLDLPYIEGASIAGQVQLFAPAAELLPSQTFRGRRTEFDQGPEISRSDLKPSGGIARVLITITDGEETMRRMTNPNGDFQFVGLKPGTWTVSLLSDDLPENATPIDNSYTFELEPGQKAEAAFRVEQRIRRMKMLSPLKVSAIEPPRAPAQACAG